MKPAWRPGRLGERRREAEALADVGDVVVDRLGHAHDADRQSARGDLAADVVSATHRAVAADDHQDVDAELDEAVDDRDGVLCAAGRSEDRPAALVDARDVLGGELDDVVPVGLDDACVAVLEADDVAHAVVGVQLEHDGADDVVQPRAQPAARDDPDLRGGRVEEDRAPWPAGLERRQLVEREAARRDQLDRVVVQDAVVLADVVLIGLALADVHRERALDGARTEGADLEIGEGDHPLILSEENLTFAGF
jgi:hypothetical protein